MSRSIKSAFFFFFSFLLGKGSAEALLPVNLLPQKPPWGSPALPGLCHLLRPLETPSPLTGASGHPRGHPDRWVTPLLTIDLSLHACSVVCVCVYIRVCVYVRVSVRACTGFACTEKTLAGGENLLFVSLLDWRRAVSRDAKTPPKISSCLENMEFNQQFPHLLTQSCSAAARLLTNDLGLNEPLLWPRLRLFLYDLIYRPHFEAQSPLLPWWARYHKSTRVTII